MPRENFKRKAQRYLTEGRLVINTVTGNSIAARCRGAGKIHDCGYHPEIGWFCGCPARSECAHIFAVKLVTAISHPLEERTAR